MWIVSSCLCLRPRNRPSVFAFCCVVICWVGWGGGGCNIVLCLRYHRFSSVNTLHIASCYIAHFCCISVNTLHVTLQSSVVLRWNTLHVMLHTSVVLRWTHFMLCCTLLLHIGEHTSCYVARFCCTSVIRLHVMLHTSVVLRWPKTVRRVRRGSTKVLAHTGTIDKCWKACKKMRPGSLSKQRPMIMTYVKAWQWRYIHWNADVCDITAKKVCKLKWWKRIAGAVAKRKTIQKNVTFRLGCSTCIFELPLQ